MASYLRHSAPCLGPPAPWSLWHSGPGPLGRTAGTCRACPSPREVRRGSTTGRTGTLGRASPSPSPSPSSPPPGDASPATTETPCRISQKQSSPTSDFKKSALLARSKTMSPKIRYLGFSFRPRSFDQAPLRIPGTVVWYSSPFGRLNWATTGSNLGPTQKTETRAQDYVFLEVLNFNV